MHWTGPDLPREDMAAWGDSAWRREPRRGTRELLILTCRGWASMADDVARDRLVDQLAAENQRLRRATVALMVLAAGLFLAAVSFGIASVLS